MIDLKSLDIKDILPPSLAVDSNVIKMCDAITPQLQDVAVGVDEAFIYSAIDTLPMPIIEFLAWQFHVSSKVEGWYLTKNDSEKRDLVKNAIALHKIKGTKAAIVRIFNILGMQADVAEWYQYDGEPYYFKVLIQSFVEITEDKFIALVEMVEEYKSVRSWFESIDLDYNVTTQGSWATSYTSTEESEIRPDFVNDDKSVTIGSFAVSYTSTEAITIKQRDELENAVYTHGAWSASYHSTEILTVNPLIVDLTQEIFVIQRFGVSNHSTELTTIQPR